MVARQGEELQRLQAVDQERHELAEENQKLRVQYSQLAKKAQAYYQEAQQYKPDEPENRDDAIRAFVQAGNSYQKAADKFGVSKTRVAQIVKLEA